MMIPTVELAPGLKISKVINGLWQIADMEKDGVIPDPILTSREMEPYVRAGLTTFDMADHYGSAEIIAGTFKKGNDLGAEARLLTKWVPTPGKLSKDEVRSAIQRALDRMQVERIDLLQFHAWQYTNPVWLDALFWLQELKDEGTIQHIGLTNFDADHLRVAMTSGIEIVSNQICFSLIDQRALDKMQRTCLELGVKILAFGTLAGGFLTEKWLHAAEPKADDLNTWSLMKYKRFIDQTGTWDTFQSFLNVLQEVARKHTTTIARVATRFILDQPAVAGIIVGARLGKSEHIRDTIGIFDLSLDDEDVSSIQKARERLDPIPGNCGDEYRKPPFLTASGDLSHHLKDIPQPFDVSVSSDGVSRISSGTEWESLAGYSRAVRKNNRILVSGTTATQGNRLIGGNDPEAQTIFILDKIEGAIESLGGKMEDVVRSRIYIKHPSIWESVARTHGRRFEKILPANTMVVADLIGDEYLVEIEAEADI